MPNGLIAREALHLSAAAAPGDDEGAEAGANQ
jgi:hypothetical protein